MQIRLLSLATVAALMLAPAAFAASMSPNGQCTVLEKQFDALIVHHATAPRHAIAEALRAEGGKLCASNQAYEGVAKLESALLDIGMKPKA